MNFVPFSLLPFNRIKSQMLRLEWCLKINNNNKILQILCQYFRGVLCLFKFEKKNCFQIEIISI